MIWFEDSTKHFLGSSPGHSGEGPVLMATLWLTSIYVRPKVFKNFDAPLPGLVAAHPFETRACLPSVLLMYGKWAVWFNLRT